ncbi:hypothetical protein FISHEDRAFT_66216 [Fistulina hepatica ATCC 64428]|uniref:Aspartate/glutamate racemase family protein n=1 Tax=Fistulina hepatica ATCC 64428 TaxID=1128425 RepID=A0A0D7A8C2_9AGAR|nr:hypothetical protein FISHEDRAFT_66216 [Fistulina hepatica ATCC 64428]
MSSEPKLGVLQLNTAFYRPPGDVGNPASFNVPTVIRVVESANRSNVVTGGKAGQATIIDDFAKEAANMMKEENCVAFVTSCGFLAASHRELAAKIQAPMGTSALLQVPWLRQLYGGGPETVGVLTFSAENLGPDHFAGIDIEGDLPPIKGMPHNCAFRRWILCEEEYDEKASEQDVVQVAKELVAENPGMKAIVFECTNMPPHTEAVKKATGLPVWSVITLGEWMYHAANPRAYHPTHI